MEEKEFNKLNNEEINKELKACKIELFALIFQEHTCMNDNNLDEISILRKNVKKIKDKIKLLRSLKNVPVNYPKEDKKTKKEKNVVDDKPILNSSELDFLNKNISGNHLNDLTNFENIEVPLIDHLLVIKQKYVSYRKTINMKIRNIRKSISILNDFQSKESIKLNQLLRDNLKLKKILSKIIKYLDKLIKIEFKKKNSLNRKEKRLIETLFADKYGIKESTIGIEKDYDIEELYSTYYELTFKDRDLDKISNLLEKYPDLYLLKNKRRLFYEIILDKYANVLLNKNYIGDSEKSKNNLEELEYYKKLILKYLSYSFENDKCIIKDLTIKKIERILTILNRNDIYIEKSKEILNQMKYFKEIIQLGCFNNNEEVKEINNEYIFSIDSIGTKIIEDAISVKKDSNYYYMNIYIPDLVSFIPRKSILEKTALDRYRNNNYTFPLDIVRFFKLNQGKKKRVIGYHFIYDSEGNIKNISIEKNIVKLYNTYSFEQFNKLFDTEDKNANILKELFELITNKKLEDINYSSSALLSFLIQNNGKIIAKYLNNQNIMCLYKNINNGEVHSIYEENDYVEFTSPIRSYVSFFNQKSMFEHINAIELMEKCEIINQKTKKIK